MSNAYVIEINEEAVGILVRQSETATTRRGYLFYAASPHYRSIEGKIFSAPAKAQKAAFALSRRGPRRLMRVSLASDRAL